MKRPLLALFCLALCLPALAQKPATLDGVTFVDEPGVLYLPARHVASILGWRLGSSHGRVYLNQKPVGTRVRELANGSALVSLNELKRRGLSLTPDPKHHRTKVRIKKRAFYAREGVKRVVVNKTHMQIRGWQGQHVVFSSPVTLGREGHETPNGIFKADGFKEKMHKSKLYHNAPMPYAVHIVGNVFIHGAKSLGAGSHGCIRLPISGNNPARWFYYWIQKGTPVSILGKWPRGAKGL